jgi:hypothetical protein
MAKYKFNLYFTFLYFRFYIVKIMIPFQKIFTLVIRTFSKPMLTYAKRKQQEKKLYYFNGFFIFFGRRYHAM